MPLIVFKGLISHSYLVRFWVAFDVCVLFQVVGVKVAKCKQKIDSAVADWHDA